MSQQFGKSADGEDKRVAGKDKPAVKAEDKKSGDGSENLSEVKLSKDKKSVIYVNVGSLNSIQYQKLEEHARAMGMDPNEAARKFVIDGIEKPVGGPEGQVPSKNGPITEIKCLKKSITINKQEQDRYYLELTLTEKQKICVNYWSVLLKGLCDRQQLQLLPSTNKLIPCCLYQDSDLNKLKKVLLRAELIVAEIKPPRLDGKDMDIAAPEDLARPPVIGIEPSALLKFLESSKETLTSVTNQIQLAKRKYGVAFGGVDQTTKDSIYLGDYQLNLIEFLKKKCEKIQNINTKTV